MATALAKAPAAEPKAAVASGSCGVSRPSLALMLPILSTDVVFAGAGRAWGPGRGFDAFVLR